MLELRGLGLDHPDTGHPLLRDAELTIGAGQITLIDGDPTQGTAPLVAALLGEAKLVAGEARVMGHRVDTLRRASLRIMRRHVGVVSQQLWLLDDRTAQDNVRLPLELDGISHKIASDRADAWLEALGVAEARHQTIESLPWPVRQRIAVARALVRDPAVIIADQPTALQDASGTEWVARALEAASLRGASVLVLSSASGLRAAAEARVWRQVAWRGQALLPLGDDLEVALPEFHIEVESARVAKPAFERPSGVVAQTLPLGLSARTAAAS